MVQEGNTRAAEKMVNQKRPQDSRPKKLEVKLSSEQTRAFARLVEWADESKRSRMIVGGPLQQEMFS